VTVPLPSCAFCGIVAGATAAHKVFEDSQTLAFLDFRPVFAGHVLVVPRHHHETLGDLPGEAVAPLFSAVARVTRGVEAGLPAEGTFVGLNNRVSQSVPHLHVHVIPRRFKDGLRGFFWPRQRYDSDEAMAEVAARVRDAIAGGGATPTPRGSGG